MTDTNYPIIKFRWAYQGDTLTQLLTQCNNTNQVHTTLDILKEFGEEWARVAFIVYQIYLDNAPPNRFPPTYAMQRIGFIRKYLRTGEAKGYVDEYLIQVEEWDADMIENYYYLEARKQQDEHEYRNNLENGENKWEW